MATEFYPQAGSSRDVNEPRIVGDVFIDYLANSSEQPFGNIRQQLTSGGLPILAQRLDAVASNRRENPNPCCDIEN